MYHEYMLSHHIQEDDARFPLAQVNNNVSVEVQLKVIGPFHHWRGIQLTHIRRNSGNVVKGSHSGAFP
jgi:iron-sulfur cluster repair protein YtfE (RIC family)